MARHLTRNPLSLELFDKLLCLVRFSDPMRRLTKRLTWEDSGKGILWPHLSDKDYALLSAARTDEAPILGPVDVLSVSDLRQSSKRQMGLAFAPMESSPGLREAKGRRRSNGNNRRRKKEGK